MIKIRLARAQASRDINSAYTIRRFTSPAHTVAKTSAKRDEAILESGVRERERDGGRGKEEGKWKGRGRIGVMEERERSRECVTNHTQSHHSGLTSAR